MAEMMFEDGLRYNGSYARVVPRVPGAKDFETLNRGNTNSQTLEARKARYHEHMAKEEERIVSAVVKRRAMVDAELTDRFNKVMALQAVPRQRKGPNVMLQHEIVVVQMRWIIAIKVLAAAEKAYRVLMQKRVWAARVVTVWPTVHEYMRVLALLS
jgi:hypothetical protein